MMFVIEEADISRGVQSVRKKKKEKLFTKPPPDSDQRCPERVWRVMIKPRVRL